MEVCRLCLDLQSENTSIQLDGTYKDMVQVVAPELNLEISNTPAVCNKCSKNLEELYVFKTKCFENEENWRDQKSDIGAGTKTDSGNLIESKKAKDIVCRTCMDPIECGSFTVLKPSKSDAYLESMLTMCLPEVDLESTKDPLLCERCTDNLLKLHQFKSACLDIEDLLVNFCETYGTNSSDQINLHSVLESESKINTDLGLRNIKCEQFDDESGDTSIKSVSDSEMTGNTSLKQEEVDIKSEEETSTGDNENKPNGIKMHTTDNSTVQKLNPVQKHFKAVHEKIKDHKCTECDFETATKQTLLEHLLKKHGKADRNRLKYCSFCTFKTFFSCQISLHIKIVHEKLKKFTCAECTYKTNDKGRLRDHLLKYHEKGDKSKLIHCTQCPFKTTSDNLLNRHVKLRHEKPREHACSACPFKTKKGYELTDHLFDEHGLGDGNKWFNCSECSYKSLKANRIKRHIIAIHEKAKDKEFACTECSFKTAHKRSLSDHLLIQHNIGDANRLKACTQCEFKAIHPSGLAKHIKSMHVRSRGHECTECDFKTTVKRRLERHFFGVHRKIEKNKLYECSKCYYKTLWPYNYRRHLKTMHEKE